MFCTFTTHANLFFIPAKIAGSSYINHFSQPDSLIPDPSNPQAWNRYAYALNNPIRFNDPDGHDVGCPAQDSSECKPNLKKELDKFKAPKKVKESEMKTIGNFLAGFQDITPGEYKALGGDLRGGKPINMFAAKKMSQIYNNAIGTTQDLFPQSDDFHNDPSDAFRHAYWNALITRDIGADFAEEFTTAHETNPDSVREEAFMDLHNNQIGRSIAIENPNDTDEELQTAVLNSLYNGELYVWDDTDIYYSDECPDCWWRAE